MTVLPADHRAHLQKLEKIAGEPASLGLTQEGKQSGRCLDNLLHRRYLVLEFNFKPMDKQGSPTIWAPLVNLWKAHGMTTLDAQAALILRLMEHGPLVMVTFSGSASLHAWFYCEREPEHVGSPIHRFMSGAATLGADTALYCPSQFARMPLGKRQTGELQTVHYLNFTH
jgi:hypothetical protein